jgi:Peptidase family M23
MTQSANVARARLGLPVLAPRRRPILPWIVPAGLLLMHAAAWGAFLSGGLRAVTAWWALISLVPILGLLSLLGSALRLAWKRRATPALLATLLLGACALWPGAWGFGIAQIAFPASLETTRPSATVRLPSDAPLRVLWGGDRVASNYHAASPDQRWAYDLVVEPAQNGSTQLGDYGCWGTPVLAPADARVQLRSDGMPDSVPLTLENVARPFGNFVSLELASGSYLVIAHLQAGSVSVRTGDPVREGQAIGRCGNSGHTSEPHIHLHHQRQPPDPALVGFAEGLPLFFRDHDGAPMPEGGVDIEGERVAFRGPTLRHLGKPLAQDL